MIQNCFTNHIRQLSLTNLVVSIAKYLPVRVIAKTFTPKLALLIYYALTQKTFNELLATNLTVAEGVIEILALTGSCFNAGFDQLH